MEWIYLITAGTLEIGWAVGLKYTYGFSRLGASLATVACMALSLFLLALSARTIPIGTGYAVWTGIGAAGTAVIGMMFLDESRETIRVFSLLFIVAGVVGLKIVSE